MTNLICFIDVFKWMESLSPLSFDARIVQCSLVYASCFLVPSQGAHKNAFHL